MDIIEVVYQLLQESIEGKFEYVRKSAQSCTIKIGDVIMRLECRRVKGGTHSFILRCDRLELKIFNVMQVYMAVIIMFNSYDLNKSLYEKEEA